jgi:F0F1-type ATP synthase alpha subunit
VAGRGGGGDSFKAARAATSSLAAQGALPAAETGTATARIGTAASTTVRNPVTARISVATAQTSSSMAAVTVMATAAG